MFSNRRVVTGLSPDARAVFVHDGPPPRTVSWSDDEPTAIHWIWSSDETPVVPHEGGDPTLAFSEFFPGPRGSRFMVETFPPGFGVGDGDRLESYGRRLEDAGIGMTMDVQEGTVHATSTIDYGVVLAGSIWLELDDGVETELRQGDCYVQTGTPHSWRNKSDQPCTMAFTIVGARRRE
jgi:hypothetical protein